MKVMKVKKVTLKKTPASKTDTVAKVLKTPAGIATPTGIDMNDVFDDLKKNYKGMTKGAFTSRAYDTARRRALKAELSEDDAKALAGQMYTNAKALWDKLVAE